MNSNSQEKYIDLCGKLVAITGGAGDIGVATAKELLKKHVKVIAKIFLFKLIK